MKVLETEKKSYKTNFDSNNISKNYFSFFCLSLRRTFVLNYYNPKRWDFQLDFKYHFLKNIIKATKYMNFKNWI